MSQFLDDEGAIQANDIMGSPAKAMLDELLRYSDALASLTGPRTWPEVGRFGITHSLQP